MISKRLTQICIDTFFVDIKNIFNIQKKMTSKKEFNPYEKAKLTIRTRNFLENLNKSSSNEIKNDDKYTLHDTDMINKVLGDLNNMNNVNNVNNVINVKRKNKEFKKKLGDYKEKLPSFKSRLNPDNDNDKIFWEDLEVKYNQIMKNEKKKQSNTVLPQTHPKTKMSSPSLNNYPIIKNINNQIPSYNNSSVNTETLPLSVSRKKMSPKQKNNFMLPESPSPASRSSVLQNNRQMPKNRSGPNLKPNQTKPEPKINNYMISPS